MGIVVPNEWQELAAALRSSKGTVLLLGETDTGKSTLCRYLLESMVTSGLTVSLVDADIGQSSLGLPGTVSFAVFRTSDEVNEFRCARYAFIGSVSPAPVMGALIKETYRLAALGRASAEITLIDTTGLVTGELGKRLKSEKIRAVRPDHIIAVERGNELAHILEPTDECKVFRIQPSPAVRPRSVAARSRYRDDKFAAYFRNSGEMLLHTQSLEHFFLGSPVRHGDVRLQAGSFVGLIHGDETVGVGVVTETDHETLLIKTPLESLRGVKRVNFGNITVCNNQAADCRTIS